jgi:hypothetical protein
MIDLLGSENECGVVETMVPLHDLISEIFPVTRLVSDASNCRSCHQDRIIIIRTTCLEYSSWGENLFRPSELALALAPNHAQCPIIPLENRPHSPSSDKAVKPMRITGADRRGTAAGQQKPKLSFA